MIASAPPLVICSAPGSSASPVAAALVDAGLFLGGPFAAGGYEDAEIAAFQKTVVESTSHATDSRWQTAARELLARKSAGRSAFGWKDGRTALLLDLWDTVCPEARWVFVYRDPTVAAWSLLRRRVLIQQSPVPFRRALLALRTWRATNRRIADFASRHPARCVVLRAPDDYGAAGEAALRAAVQSWSVPLAPPELVATFRPHLVKRRAPRWIRVVARALPGVSAAWQAMEALRTNPAGAETVAAPAAARRTLCVYAADIKRAASQTFVHDHLQRLPARTVLLHHEDGALLTQDDLPLLTPIERVASTVLGEFGYGTDGLRDRALARFLARERAEAMLIEFANHASKLVPGCRAAGVPIVVHCHGFDVYRHELLLRKADQYPGLFEAAGAVIAVSRDMERQLVRIGVPTAKIRYAPCGVDGARFHGADPAAAPPTFVAIGRFVEKKGPHLTLLAFRDVLAACPESRLVMVGEGPVLTICRSLAQQLGLDGAVAFRGMQTSIGVLTALRSARGFVQHSVVTGGDSEGTPVAVLEASACGLPVIATRHAGIPDVVRHGESGYLVAEGDVAAMAGHMIELARDPALAAALGRRARERILAEFSTEHAIPRLWRVIDEVIDGRGRNAGR